MYVFTVLHRQKLTTAYKQQRAALPRRAVVRLRQYISTVWVRHNTERVRELYRDTIFERLIMHQVGISVALAAEHGFSI